MSDYILSLIIGGGIAIVSGGLSHFLNNFFKYKNDKDRYVFEKLEDIIECVSSLEQMMQQDIGGIFKLLKPDSSKDAINLTFHQNKLECLINIYHHELSDSFKKLNDSINKYHQRKRNIIQIERNKNTDEKILIAEYNGLSSDFNDFISKSNGFVKELSRYGNRKMR